MALRVYNTLTRQKEEFQTVQPGQVGMYVCGPTVYKPSHVGHMVGPVIFDTVKRYLSYLGYQVTLVVNITDVDDKLIVEAAKQQTTVPELAERVTADYCRNLQRLGVVSIDHMPRATQHIGDIIQIIHGLIDRGYAYPAGGDVYFDISKDPDYGKLCNRDPEQLEAGARIEVSDKKRNPGDFALWKGAKPGEPQWDSPWGPGRPGWHIECSAMSMKLLGKTLDIHGGGLDLQFPHHENELAQSESYTGVPFVRYWMHNGLMKIEREKISKTREEEQKKKATLVVSEVLAKHPPETVRFLLLGTHYRSPIEYSADRLQEVRRSLEGFYRFFERYRRVTGKDFHDLVAPTKQGPFDIGTAPNEFVAEVARLRAAFLESLADDFNTGGAIGLLYELLTALNRFADARQLEGPQREAGAVGAFERGAVVLRELSQILGLFREPPPTSGEVPAQLLRGLEELARELSLVEGGGPERSAGAAQPREQLDALLRMFIRRRAEARKARDFALADQVRQRLGQLGVTLEDRPGGTDWRLS